MIEKQNLISIFCPIMAISGIASAIVNQYFLGCLLISTSIILQSRFSLSDQRAYRIILAPASSFFWIVIIFLRSAMGPEQIIQGVSLVMMSSYSLSLFDKLGELPKIAFHSSWAISASSAILFSFFQIWEASTIILLFIHLYTFPNFNTGIKWDLPITFLSLGLGIRFTTLLLSASNGGGMGNDIDIAHELWIMFLSGPIFGVAIYFAIIEKIMTIPE